MNAKGLRATVGLLAAPLMLGLTACEWFSDFKREPSLWTWEPTHCNLQTDECVDTIPSRGNPQFSVPVYGTARAGFETSYQPFPNVIDSLASVPNPTPVSAASLANGHKYYQINCAVCHGDKGVGDGPATKFGMAGISLLTDMTKGRTDGYIYGMIRNGRGIMPPYNRIEEMDRWDVVNYVRALQGSTAIAAEIGPLAAPGVTGRWVPGYTKTAPTLQAPFVSPMQGSAKNYYPAGSTAPQLSPNAPRVGAPLPDSNSYKQGNTGHHSTSEKPRS